MGDDIGIGYGNYNQNDWGNGGYMPQPGDFGSGFGSSGGMGWGGFGGMGSGGMPKWMGGTGMNMGQAMGMGAGIGNILGGIFGGMNNKNPMNSAMPYMNQSRNDIQNAFNPYIKTGQAQLPGLQQQYGQLTSNLPGLQQQYGQLTSNPGGVVNAIGSSFHQSPGFQFQIQQALGAANRAAAAGGMAGSPMEQQNIAGTVNGLANQDYYNYLGNAENMYNRGLAGQQQLYGMGLQGQQGLYGMGYGASQNMGEDLGQLGMSQAQLAYAGQADQNQQNGAIWGMIGSGIGDAATAAMMG